MRRDAVNIASCPTCDTVIESVSGSGTGAAYALHPCGHRASYDVATGELVARSGSAHAPQPLSEEGQRRQDQRDRIRATRAERQARIEQRRIEREAAGLPERDRGPRRDRP